MEDLEREYFPSLVISTNIDEELAKHNIDHSDNGLPKTVSATASKNTWSNQIEINEDHDGSASSTLFVQNPWTQKSNNQSNDSNHALDGKGEGTGKGNLPFCLSISIFQQPIFQSTPLQTPSNKNSAAATTTTTYRETIEGFQKLEAPSSPETRPDLERELQFWRILTGIQVVQATPKFFFHREGGQSQSQEGAATTTTTVLWICQGGPESGAVWSTRFETEAHRSVGRRR